MKTAGIILDLYDDSNARVLRECLGARPFPEKLASMDVMTSQQHDQIPNHLFAFVGINGEDTLRKFAMHNEAHLVSSLIYFMETGHLLPDEAQKVAAHNLCLGCYWYNVEPPEKIVKIADLTGTEMMPASGSLKSGAPKRTNTAKNISIASKTASGRLLSIVGPQLEQVGWRGPINVTHLEAPTLQKLAAHTNYALLNRYPIDSVSQIKMASVYFEEHWGKFAMVDRHIFSTNLQNRATEVGMGDVGGMVREYAGIEYGTKIAGELKSRIRGMEGSEHAPVYELLLEKVASTSPEFMAQMLMEADRATGVVDGWNKPHIGYADPYRAVFSKTADDATDPKVEPGLGEKQWSWSMGSDYVNDTMIRDFVLKGHKQLASTFGDDFAKAFCKDPVTVFKSLPDPQKHAIARMAGDNSGTLYRKT